MSHDIVATACKPNISPAGRHRRRRFGAQWTGIAIAAATAGFVLRLPWAARGIVALPAALAAIGFLQARRQTCVLRAHEGTFEREDFTTEKAPEDEVAKSREVAAGIRRDALLIGAGAGALAAATSLVR
jgi:hypothetical protein